MAGITWPVHLMWDESSSDGSVVRIIRQRHSW